jgi:hypothetical protein
MQFLHKGRSRIQGLPFEEGDRDDRKRLAVNAARSVKMSLAK